MKGTCFALLALAEAMSASILPLLSQRQAYVRVQNNFMEPITNVTLLHRVSGIISGNVKHLNNRTWDMIKAGMLGADRLEVGYETGAFSDDEFWWLSWVRRDGQLWRFYSAAPKDVVVKKLDDETTMSRCWLGAKEHDKTVVLHIGPNTFLKDKCEFDVKSHVFSVEEL